MSERIIIATTTQRIFFTCQNCEARWTFDYTVDTVEQLWRGKHLASLVSYRMDGDRKQERYNDAAMRTCSECGAKGAKEKALGRIKLSPDHVCDDRCRMAISEHCTCSCGGENHGIAHRRSL